MSSAAFGVEATDGKDEILGESGGVAGVRAEVTWTMVVVAPTGPVPDAVADETLIDGRSSSPLPAVPA